MRPFETLENKIVILPTPSGEMIIGKIAEGEMINPRVIHTEPTEKKDSIMIRFPKLFGDPNSFFLPVGGYYVSENVELNERYEASVEPKRIIVP